MIEGHDQAEAPPKCAEGNHNLIFILNSFWVNDTAVASWLRSTYHMPTIAGPITMTIAAGAALETHEWRWRPENATVESVVSFNSTGQAGAPSAYILRVAWPNGQGITYMDFKETYSVPPDVQVVTGRMEPPMLYPTGRPNPYVGQGELQSNVSIETELHAFKDFKCEQPL
ncbi:MAG: hypothetical protein V4510_04820 [bacterium]